MVIHRIKVWSVIIHSTNAEEPFSMCHAHDSRILCFLQNVWDLNSLFDHTSPCQCFSLASCSSQRVSGLDTLHRRIKAASRSVKTSKSPIKYFRGFVSFTGREQHLLYLTVSLVILHTSDVIAFKLFHCALDFWWLEIELSWNSTSVSSI